MIDVLYMNSFLLSPHEQIKYGKYKYEYYKNGKLLDTEINELNIRWYYPDEIINNTLMKMDLRKVKYFMNDLFVVYKK